MTGSEISQQLIFMKALVLGDKWERGPHKGHKSLSIDFPQITYHNVNCGLWITVSTQKHRNMYSGCGSFYLYTVIPSYNIFTASDITNIVLASCLMGNLHKAPSLICLSKLVFHVTPERKVGIKNFEFLQPLVSRFWVSFRWM